MNPFLVFLESNTTVGSLYTDKAAEIGFTPVLLTAELRPATPSWIASGRWT